MEEISKETQHGERGWKDGNGQRQKKSISSARAKEASKVMDERATEDTSMQETVMEERFMEAM